MYLCKNRPVNFKTDRFQAHVGQKTDISKVSFFQLSQRKQFVCENQTDQTLKFLEIIISEAYELNFTTT